MRKLIAAAVEAHRLDPELHHVLAEQTPRIEELEGVELFQRGAFALFRAYLEDHRYELGALDLDLATFVCVTSIEALTHNAVIHRSVVFADQSVEALVDEASRLIIGYLGVPCSAAA